MTRRVLYSLAFALPLLGCPKRNVLPDPSVPHQVAQEARIRVWCRAPDGKQVKCRVRLLEGWWVAAPELVEP
jgi:hypothetical protein